MNNRDSYGLILVGILIRLLRNAGKDLTAEIALDSFERLKKELEIAEFHVSLTAINNINNLRDVQLRIMQLKKSEPIGNESFILNQGMGVIEDIVFSESLTKNIYVIPERRYNGSYLLNEPEKLLQKNVFNKLTDIAKTDFRAACRCLCFGEGTAGAFQYPPSV